ncbi:hypothetical protein Droror1_Dr00016051 [Drosera rotundifolia]
MAAKINHIDDVRLNRIEEGDSTPPSPHGPTGISNHHCCCSLVGAATMLQKLLAEAIGTYFIVFTGCAAIVVEKTKGTVTYPGICVTWGLIILIVIYTLGHISGAHFNPAVTIAFTVCRHFPLAQAPMYITAQIIGSLLASGTLSLLLNVTEESYFGTLPTGSDLQAVVMEIIISFILMFVVYGTAIDDRAHKEFAGVVIGMTILMNALIAGSISGASMNPARSIGPAVVRKTCKKLWIYVVGPTVGCVAGGATYNLVKHLDKFPSAIHDHPLPVFTKHIEFQRMLSHNHH